MTLASPPEGVLSQYPALARLRWSAATAAFQVEGARAAQGRGRSIWDDFVDAPGRVRDGSTAEPGPDSFHRLDDDVELAARLGLDRYRFSISWVRVHPDGGERTNAEGLAYYDRLVDELLAAGVTPFPTLYHWDLPAPLEAAGGWLVRDTAERFASYTQTVADALGDRVRNWYTINEPVSTSLQGYAIGELAPGRQLLFGALPTVHHQLLAHGLASQILHERGAEQVGVANNHTWVLPASASEADQEAAYVYDLIHNRMYIEPLLLGAYPDLSMLGVDLPILEGDMQVISSGSDFYGVNYYNPTAVAASDGPIPFEIVPIPDAPHTGFGDLWPIVPEGLTSFLVDARERYDDRLPPLIIGENGASFPEPDSVTGPLQDDERISYLQGHIEAVGLAMEAGVQVEEYTVWSLLDNFEWAEGFSQRFGLVHVDMQTSERTPKASFEWFRSLIAQANQ